MTDAQIEVCDDLWREALAAGLVRWMPGMLTRWRWRALVSAGSRCLAASDGEGLCVWRETHDWLVDWTDPATIGCLLAMAREAWSARVYVTPASPESAVGGWLLCSYDSDQLLDRLAAHTEPEALLRAILATRGE